MTDLLTVEGLDVSFEMDGNDVPVVRDLAFSVAEGEVVAIVGESGSGKSVTALTIMGLLPPAAVVRRGRICYQGVDLLDQSRAKLRAVRGREIAMVFQDPTAHLNPSLTVGRQLTEGLEYHLRMRPDQAKRRAEELLELVGVPDPTKQLGRYPHHFSGGMRQRVLIAMALACHPKLLIADEPTTALDVTIQAQILELLANLRHEMGMSILLISHDLGVVSGLSDQVLVMYGGRIVEGASVVDTFRGARHPYTQGILRAIPRLNRSDAWLEPIPGQPPQPGAMPTGCAFHPRCQHATEQCRESVPQLEFIAPNHQVRCWVRPSAVDQVPGAGAVEDLGRRSDHKAETLVVSGLTVTFPVKQGALLQRTVGAVHAVDDVSLMIAKGETLSLVGESGSGKTTTGRAILQLVKPDSGSVSLDGQELTTLHPRDLRRARRNMQLVFQDPYTSLNPRQQVGSMLEEVLSINGVKSKVDRRDRVRQALEEVGLPASARDRYPHEFSGGQRQRISIARAIATRPSLVICDEPVSALDVSIQAQVVNLLRELQAGHELAYLFIAHDLGVVRNISHHVAVMYLGLVVEMGPAEAVYARPLHPYTRALLSSVQSPDRVERSPSRRIVLGGEIPSPMNPPSGCPFRTRCPHAAAICAETRPSLDVVAPGHSVRCHLWESISDA